MLSLLLAAVMFCGLWSFSGASVSEVYGAESLKPEAPALEGFLAPVTQKTEVPDGYTGIYTAAQLMAIEDAPDQNYILMADLDLSSYIWEPLCSSDLPFTGIFEGNGHVISNLNGKNGLFSNIDEAQIRNVGLEHAYIYGAYDNQWQGTMAGIVVYAGSRSTVYNCYYQGDIEGNPLIIGGIAGNASSDLTVEDCWMKGDILSTNAGSGFDEPYVGGIIGGNYGNSFTITGCIHNGAIETHGYAAYVGGILGQGKAEISYCQNYGTIVHYYKYGDIGGISGSINGLTIEYCMNAADLTVEANQNNNNATIGGLSATGKDIRHSFNCGNITAAGASYVGGISGRGNANYCYNVGTVVSEDPGSASVDPGYNGAGALFGQASGASSHCYYLEGELGPYSSVNGSPVLTDITALSESEMCDPSNFTGFSFGAVWQMGSGDYPYPVLRDKTRGPAARLRLYTEVDEDVMYQKIGNDVIGMFCLRVSASLQDILDQETYVPGPVTFTVKLTGGLSFSPDGKDQETTIVSEIPQISYDPAHDEMEREAWIYILDDETGTIQITAESNDCEAVSGSAFRPRLEFLDIQEDAWALVNSSSSFCYGADYEIPKSRYQEVYGERYGELIYSHKRQTWGGNCGGMAWTAALIATRGLNLPYGRTGLVNHQADGVRTDWFACYVYAKQKSDLTKLIERYQLFQSELMAMCGPEFSEILNSLPTEYWKLEPDGSYSHRTDGTYIRQICDAVENSTQPLIAAVAWKGNAHALVITGNQLEDAGNGWYRVQVYDCNHPYLDDAKFHPPIGHKWASAYDEPDRYLELNPDKNLFRYRAGANASESDEVHGSKANEDTAMTYDTGAPDLLAVYNTKDLAMTEIDPDAYQKYRAESLDSRVKFEFKDNDLVLITDDETSELMVRIENGMVKELADSVSYTPQVGEEGGTLILPGGRRYRVATDGAYTAEGKKFYTEVEGSELSVLINGMDDRVDVTADQDGKASVTVARLGETDADTEAVKVSGILEAGSSFSVSYEQEGRPEVENEENLKEAELAVLGDDGFVSENPGEPTATFADVPVNEWFYEDVEYVNDRGIMTGMGEDKTYFAPYSSLARAQFATILHRMAGELTAASGKEFPDVGSGDWYVQAVRWASQEEVAIITGYSNGLFGPADLITREQLAVMMFRYAAYMGIDNSARAPIGGYLDADKVNEFAEDAIQWAVAEGILSGKYGQTQLDPQGTASRAECAVIIRRFMEKYGE